LPRASPEENIIRYHFMREDSRWLIDDIRGADDTRRVRCAIC
jgi:hypothetical protein